MTLKFTRKPADILFNIKDGDYITIVGKKTRITFSHTIKIINEFEEHKLITIKKEGRLKLIFLTTLGEELQYKIKDIIYFERRIKNGKDKRIF